MAQRKLYNECASRMPAETPELLINQYTSLLLFAILHKHVQTFYIYPSFATA